MTGAPQHFRASRFSRVGHQRFFPPTTMSECGRNTERRVSRGSRQRYRRTVVATGHSAAITLKRRSLKIGPADAIKLVSVKVNGPYTVTLWVDPSTYLPVRLISGTGSTPAQGRAR